MKLPSFRKVNVLVNLAEGFAEVPWLARHTEFSRRRFKSAFVVGFFGAVIGASDGVAAAVA